MVNASVPKEKHVKKVLYLFLVLAILFALGCQSSGSGRTQGTTGRVVIYTSMYDYVIEPIWKSLQEEFPNIGIQFVYGGTGALQQKINIDKASGRLGADILMVAEPSYSLELKESGMLHPFKSKEFHN